MKKLIQKRKWIVGLLLAVCLPCLTACSQDGGSTKVIFTTGFGKDEVFRIADESCRLDELMVYLTNIQNQYQQVYGAPIWDVTLDGVTMEENVKEMVLARIAQVKTMYLLAKEREITLTDEEENRIQTVAKEYFDSLNASERELMGTSLAAIEELYREYALANKVYQEIIQDINPEISDDEARTITVQHILIRTYNTDGTGKRIPYSDAAKQAAYDKICEIRQLAVDGEHDFMELASHYSEDSNVTYSFGKGEMEASLENVAFNLETDEISAVVESEEGYHIIKCLNTFDREETDANKVKIVEQRRKDVFGQEYDRFVSTLVRNLNQKLWDEVTLIRDENVNTADFFVMYDRYFEE